MISISSLHDHLCLKNLIKTLFLATLFLQPIKKNVHQIHLFYFFCSTRLYDDDDDDGIFKTCTYLMVATYKHSTIKCEYFFKCKVMKYHSLTNLCLFRI